MKVYVTEEAGFCFGVRRALNIIEQLHEKGNKIHIYGQLIHNRIVLDELKSRGIDYIESLDNIDERKTLIIRTHGIPRQVETGLRNRSIPLVDATCPLVKKLQKTLEKLNSPLDRVILVGDRHHPEIIAAQSYAANAIVSIVQSEKEAEQIEDSETLHVAAQTTLDFDFYTKTIAVLQQKTKHLHIHETICNATRDRQEGVKKLAPKVDAVVVVGGKNSSNTQKLYSIALELNPNSFLVESWNELDNREFLQKASHFKSIGIAAGASTPPQEIEKINYFLNNFKLYIDEKEMYHGRTTRNSNTEH